MTVAELIEKLKDMPGDETVWRWDSDRGEDGTETRVVRRVDFDLIRLGDGETMVERVILQ